MMISKMDMAFSSSAWRDRATKPSSRSRRRAGDFSKRYLDLFLAEIMPAFCSSSPNGAEDQFKFCYVANKLFVYSKSGERWPQGGPSTKFQKKLQLAISGGGCNLILRLWELTRCCCRSEMGYGTFLMDYVGLNRPELSA